MGGLVPAAISAGGAVGSALIGRHSGGSPLTAGEGSALTSAMTSARTAASQGSTLFGMGAPLLSQAASYYQRLLGGDRATVGMATAPQRQGITEAYTGAERGLEATPTLRGGAKEVARAELARQKVGQLGMLVPNAINAAAPAAASLGLGATGAGTSATGQAGSLYSTLTGQGENARQFDTEQGYRLGSNIGGFLTNLLSTYYQGKGAGTARAGTTSPYGLISDYAATQAPAGGWMRLPPQVA